MNQYLILSIILVCVVGYSQKTALKLDALKIAIIILISSLIWCYYSRPMKQSQSEQVEKMASCGCSAIATNSEQPINNPIIVYNATQEPKGDLRLYYASWCGYSRQFLPIWKEFVEKAKQLYPWLTMTEIRCEGANESICYDDKIDGYPTVKLHVGNNIYDLSNDNFKRTVDGLNLFIKKYIQ